MMLKQISLSLMLSLLLSVANAQKSAVYTNDLVQFNRALQLYQDHQYKAAQKLFKQVKNNDHANAIEADCAYYIANCAVRLNQSNADELMQDFMQDYPTSTRRNAAYLEVANYYFETGEYARAKKWFDKVNTQQMNKEEQAEFNFNNGYAAFKNGQKEEAKKYFNRVRDHQEYGSQAKYYIGFMAYEGDDYEQANQLFDEVKTEGRNNKNLSYFQSDMNFKLGKFQKAIDLAKEQLERSNRQEQSELNKIIGESYFNLEQYEQAIPYLKEYRGKQGKWNNTDYYQLGYAYYKQGDYENAIAEFNKIIGGQNHVAQNAYYHLAESYIKSGRKQQALNAFKNASEMSFDEKIQEDAALNYAKLSYEIGNSYKSIPEVLTGFLEKYPNHKESETISGLLVDSYITSKNYKEAMKLLEGSNAYDDKLVYQKVAYYRGVELYQEGDFRNALTLFEKSLSERNNQTFTAKATYWKAECQYLLEDYQPALIGYKEFKGMSAAKQTQEFKGIDYNIGYTYFKQRDYNNAVKHFKLYTESNSADKASLNDAYLRLGDSYFATSDYWKAMESYNESINMKGIDSDYAYFQKAISYGFVNKNDRKIEDLKQFLQRYTKSIYRDDAWYELGNTYVAEEQSEKALDAYQKLINEQPKSAFVSKSLLKQGLIYYNTDRGEQALTKFKKVVADFPNTDEASQAVKSARGIYVDLGRTDEYAVWIKQLDFVEVADSDIDNATFESAEQQFIDNNDEKAINGFKKYLKDFPNGLHAMPAHFYLAQLQYKKGDLAAARPHYRYVIEQPRNEYTEQSLARLSQVLLENSDYQTAIPVLKRLENEADFAQNITFAQSNLMKAYYQQDNYQETITYADKVLADDKIQDNVKSDAKIFTARAAMKIGNNEKAKQAYAEVQKIASGELAAEAQYYDAFFKREAGDYKASNEAVQVLAKDFSGYKTWGGKGLLLMAKNYQEEDLYDPYQSSYILESIIKSFSKYPEIVSEAKEELKLLKAEEAKTNASVEAEEN